MVKPAALAFSASVLFMLAHQVFGDSAWSPAHATYYGGSDAMGTNSGACGYGNQVSSGYGVLTVAVSSPLFKNGAGCGACYEVRCSSGSTGCAAGNPSVVVTATNLCPGGSDGGWCDVSKTHFDLSEPAFSKIAVMKAGHVAIDYRRVSCSRKGGIRFTISGNPNFNSVNVQNVAGAGDVVALKVKGSNTAWKGMSQDWGQTWKNSDNLTGQSLSFQVTASDGRTVTCSDVAPANWSFGQTFEGCQFS